jgi:hypothetical protein
MKVELLLNDCNGQVLPISEGYRRNSSQFKPCKGNNLTTWHTWTRRASRVATVHNTVKETIRAHLTLVRVFHAYASADTPWVAHALSHCTPVKYGRIAFVSATHKATQFVGPYKISYVPVHNSNLLIEARWSVLNRHRRGLPPWSSEFQIRPLSFLPIQYSPFFSNGPPGLLLCILSTNQFLNIPISN